MATASSQYFVVKPKSSRLPDCLQAVPAGTTGLFVYRSSSPETAPRLQWDRLMRDYGEQLEFASPVMVDRRGREMLPTGKVVVQFHNPPTAEAVHQFGAIFGLRYLTTNEFAANQLTFEPAGKSEYLPDLIRRLESNSNVKFAAPETLGRFSRL
jgi:hypothetical protein